MSAEYKSKNELAALQSLLDSHGGDSARWPASARLQFEDLIAHDVTARSLLEEARALDSVLMQAPIVSDTHSRALVDRIMAAATTLAAPADQRGQLIDLAAQRQQRAQPAVIRRRTIWQASGMLAASLMAGIVIGITGTGASLGDLTSLFTDTDTLTATMSLAVDGPDEDVL